MVGKKAQGGPGLGTLVGLAVIVIAAVLIILFLTGVFGDLRGQTENIPSALATKAEICKSLSTNQVAFCEFTKVDLDGVKGDSYVNCFYKGNTAFKNEVEKAGSTITCDNAGAEFCSSFSEVERKEIFVNRGNCEALGNLGNLG